MATREGTASALKAGAFALIYLAVLNGISAAAAIISAIWIELFPGEADSFPLPYKLIMVALMISATAALSILGMLILKKHSLIAACIGLIWILWDVIGHQGLSLAAPAIPFGISGVRGTLAAKRLQESRTNNPDE